MIKIKEGVSFKKSATISARCLPIVKKRLKILTETEHLTESEIISKCVLEYFKRKFSNKEQLDEEEKFFGRFSSKKGDLSVNRKKYLKDKVHAKHRRH